jgi:hypothetical protein
MGFKLIAPGKRKGNRVYLIRGRYRGRQYESSTGTTDKEDARQYRREFIQRLKRGADAGEPRTFAEAAIQYVAGRGVSVAEERYVNKLSACRRPDRGKNRMSFGGKRTFGEIRLDEIKPVHIAQAANLLYPGCLNETKNRQAYTPAASVVHFANQQDWCPYIVVRRLEEREPETRKPTERARQILLSETEGELNRLMVVLFYQGWRITETLTGTSWERTSLKDMEFEIWINKARRWKKVAMHPESFGALVGENDKTGRLFKTFKSRWDVYKALKPILREHEISFTPHMARHWFGTTLGNLGSTNLEIANAGTWTSENTVSRYTNAGMEKARETINRLPLGGKAGGKNAKSL